MANRRRHEITRYGSEGRPRSFYCPGHPFVGLSLRTLSKGYYYAITDFHKLVKLDVEGNILSIRAGFGEETGRLRSPRGIDVDSSEKLYIADKGNSRIQIFDMKSGHVTEIGNDRLQAPHQLAVAEADDRIYCVDADRNKVVRFSLGQGSFDFEWGDEGEGVGQFLSPTGLAIDEAGDIYVADTGNSRIQKFSSDGRYICHWGSSGMNRGEFRKPIAVFAEKCGKILVTDQGNFRIQKFTMTARAHEGQ